MFLLMGTLALVVSPGRHAPTILARCCSTAYNDSAMEPSQPQPQFSPVSGRARAAQSDQVALIFLLACCVLVLPLLFATRMPQAVLMATLVALLLVFGGRAVLTRSILPRTVVDWPNILTLLLVPVGLWASADLSASWPVACKIVAGFAIFYGLAGLARSRWLDFLPWVFLVLAAGLALVVLFGTNWTTVKIPILPDSLYRLFPQFRLPWRPEGIHPNLAGGVMALLLLPAIAMAWWGQGRVLRVVALGTAGLVGLTLLLSQSRGAWLGAAGAMVIMPALRYRRWWVGLAILLMALLVFGLLGPSRLVGMLFPNASLGEASINTLTGRMELWSRAIYLIQDFSLTGAGLGMFEKVVMVLYPPFFIGSEGGFIHAHNIFLQTAAEMGLPGLIVHLALLIGLAASLIAATRHILVDQANRTNVSLAMGLFGSLVVYALHGMVEAPPAAPRGYVLAFALFGSAAALCNHILITQRSPAQSVIQAHTIYEFSPPSKS